MLGLICTPLGLSGVAWISSRSPTSSRRFFLVSFRSCLRCSGLLGVLAAGDVRVMGFFDILVQHHQPISLVSALLFAATLITGITSEHLDGEMSDGLAWSEEGMLSGLKDICRVLRDLRCWLRRRTLEVLRWVFLSRFAWVLVHSREKYNLSFASARFGAFSSSLSQASLDGK